MFSLCSCVAQLNAYDIAYDMNDIVVANHNGNTTIQCPFQPARHTPENPGKERQVRTPSPPCQ